MAKRNNAPPCHLPRHSTGDWCVMLLAGVQAPRWRVSQRGVTEAAARLSVGLYAEIGDWAAACPEATAAALIEHLTADGVGIPPAPGSASHVR